MTNKDLTIEYFSNISYLALWKQVYEEREDLVLEKYEADEGVETEAGQEILILHYF